MSVMAVCEVKQAAVWLRRYIKALEEQDTALRIVCIYGESKDATLSILKHWSRITKHTVEVYADPYLPPEERNGWSLARIKRESQKLFLEGDQDYYFTCDSDNVQMPTDLISKLIADDKDVVAPYVWTEGRRRPTFYDTYVFRVDGCRFHLYDPPGYGSQELLEVDSVGNCFLATRNAMELGVYTNPFPQIHFCKDIREKGLRVWVDPRLNTVHVDLERYNILHYPPPIALTQSQFIDDKGDKYTVSHVQMEQRLEIHEGYIEWIRSHQPQSLEWMKDFDDSRPLVTASYKVFNEAEYLPYSLRAVYPYVDRIDVVEGAVQKNMHCANADGSSIDETVSIVKAFPDPDDKIRLVQGKWKSKEHIQNKLLELCESRWMMFIDGDEVYRRRDLKGIRKFCLDHLDGSVSFVVPERTLNFWHDWKHVAYSLNVRSPWGRTASMHPFLIWRDIVGLNFNMFHTYPVDVYGRNIALDPYYELKRVVLDDVHLYHYGHAKSAVNTYNKLVYFQNRGSGEVIKSVEEDMWFSGEMPSDFVLKEYKGRPPKVLKGHPLYGKTLIKVVSKKPVYRFERL